MSRILDGTSAPPGLKAKACAYTWESACAAADTSKLLVELGERLERRPASCVTNPASCATRSAQQGSAPSSVWFPGPGRCEVCGFAAERTLWVVLPPDWRAFKFTLASEPTNYRYVYVNPSSEPSTDRPAALEVALPSDVDAPDQDLTLFSVAAPDPN